MKRIIISMLAIAAMTSCSKTETNDITRDANSSVIEFGSAITATTKTPGINQFSNGDVIKVIGMQADAAAPSADFTTPYFNDNYAYDNAGSKFTSIPANEKKWTPNKFHNFYAYYPNDLTAVVGASGATIDIDMTGLAAGAGYANDLLGAKQENVAAYTRTGDVFTGKEANLAFKHMLSKVKFEIKKLSTAGTADLTKMSFTMASNKGVYNIATCEVGNLTTGDVKIEKAITPNYIITETATAVGDEWIVLPGDQIKEMVFTVNGGDIKATKLVGMATEPGKITTITITYVGDVITFTSSIEDWDAIAGSGDLE